MQSEHQRVRFSKFMTKILRHNMLQYGLQPTADGYVPLTTFMQVLQKECRRDLKALATEDTIHSIVSSDSKGRFNLIEREERRWIRANQGHSQSVGACIEDDQLLELVQEAEPLDACCHGTYRRFLASIEKEGLKVMKREHIHLACGPEAKSGYRSNCDTFIYIDVRKAMADGILFYRSANGVILTRGKDGVLSPEYFSRIQFRYSKE